MKRRTLLSALAVPIVAGLVGVRPGAAAPSGLDAVLAAPDWLNGRLGSSDVAGKVVLVDVFTFGCINCQHVTPALRRLHASVASSDLAIIGVHAPETPYEHDRENVVRELARQGVVWPVALDNGFVVWKALANEYWPTQYLFDRKGVLRRTVVGEGQDDVVIATVQKLIAER